MLLPGNLVIAFLVCKVLVCKGFRHPIIVSSFIADL